VLHAQVLEIRQRILGVEHPNTLISMNELGSTYLDQGKWKEAEVLHAQVLEMSQRIRGAEHPSTLTSMNNLGLTYSNQGKWKAHLMAPGLCLVQVTRQSGSGMQRVESRLGSHLQ